MADAKTYDFAAVLTGDLIASRSHTPEALDTAMAALDRAANDLAASQSLPIRFARYRGDGWQMFLPEGEMALSAALQMIAALAMSRTGLTTRIGIGLGAATVPQDGALAAAQGEAFTVAGDVLDGLGRGERLGLTRIADRSGPALRAMTMLLDYESRSWTPTQAEALYEAMRATTPTQDDIAKTLGVTRQAVQSRLAGTSFPAIREALSAFESTIQDAWSSAS